ncbi:carboxylate-amine ligase [Nocardioides solisilvae]|uniref:carboxylate-amine ligase n=1 Tax=Nocardioides solisilvae TaxID=1542435 RepID=UPI000D743A5D|nr:glutamate--cysteine ligase [Nocardioides solisilvae]
MRAMGVEEELLLVDPTTGAPTSRAAEVLRAAAVREERDPAPATEKGGSLGHELQKSQVETDTPPETSLAKLEEALRAWRERTRVSALEVGARVLATGTSPLEGGTSHLRTPRFDAMAARYGLTLAEQLTCGCHVHVDVADDDEGVAVLDRIRVWLPVLLALSANSPWTSGVDTAYESYRSQMMVRWPSSGPTPVFGSVKAYRAHVQAMLDTEVLLDEGMVYSDARVSAQHPTVEVRAADVCLDVRDTVLVAALSRALVETAAGEWADGRPAPAAEVPVLRLATWQAGRYGLDGQLVDPTSCHPKPAREVLDAMLEHVDDALGAYGDRELVHAGVDRLFAEGTGSVRQRALLAEHDPATVVSQLARITAGEE